MGAVAPLTRLWVIYKRQLSLHSDGVLCKRKQGKREHCSRPSRIRASVIDMGEQSENEILCLRLQELNFSHS